MGEVEGEGMEGEGAGMNPPFEDERTVVEQPDKAEGLHLFTANVMGVAMPENKVFPWVEKYGGSTDPVKHLRSFVDVIVVYSSDELVWCRVFSLSLKEEALDRFHSLQPRTIDSFATLRRLFSQQYASNRSRGLTYTALVRMRQGKEESLKGFMGRFNQTTWQVRNVDQRLIVSALTTALRPRPFVDYLYEEEPEQRNPLQAEPQEGGKNNEKSLRGVINTISEGFAGGRVVFCCSKAPSKVSAQCQSGRGGTQVYAANNLLR
ncbi:uncharacterized protein LOC106754889 [Vigna radiata var. radiata]|uniref:Uncharacterized protein LOC106754889 n=1 Tax=Vigna radiata var. radiata TaxID=3916 RepID=A0A1S3TF99_VIGRR|nr:uncharacterized protein LOC106754889 [Vigna radiata var. radiata]